MMNIGVKQSKVSHPTESGAILIMFVILAPLLLLLLALATDVAFLTGGSVELQRISDAIALDMLKQYQDHFELEFDPGVFSCANQCSSCPCSEGSCGRLARICGALDATKAMFDNNFREAVVEGRLENRAGSYTSSVALKDFADTSNTLVTVAFGKWHFEFPVGIEPSELPSDCFVGGIAVDNFKPCFQELAVSDVGKADPEQVSAFRVTTASSEQNKVRTFLMHAFDSAVTDLGATATAAVVPRRGVFIVDTTVSTTVSTHSSDSSDPSFFAWDLRAPQCSGIGASLISECPTCTSMAAGSCPNLDSCPLVTENLIQRSYRNWLESSSSPSSANHEREDFSCVEVSFDGGPVSRTFLIDTTMKPQPLGDILSSVNSAMRAFRQRGIAGDRFGFVGFDNELLAVRSTGGAYAMVAPGDTAFEAFEAATNLGADNGIFDGVSAQVTSSAFVDYFLFPRLLSYPNGTVTLTGTNIPLGLSRAKSMLQSTEGFNTADNFIVVFTDGQSNCLSESNCQGSAGHWEGSRGLVIGSNGLTEDFQDLRDKKIAVHFVLIGEASVPHERMFKDPECTDSSSDFCCMDFVDYLAAKRSDPTYEAWVDSSDPNFPNNNNQPLPDKTEWPNSWYDLSEQSRGWWTPVRPPCSDYRNISNYPQAEDAVEPIKRAFSKACFNKAVKTKAIESQDIEEANELFNNTPNVIDNKGRVLCDPLSRSIEEQLTDRIRDDILGYSPFQLVQ